MRRLISLGFALATVTAGCGLSEEQRKAEVDVIADAGCAGVFDLASQFTSPEYAKDYKAKRDRLKAMAVEAEKKLPSSGWETRTDKVMRDTSDSLGAHIQEADWSAKLVAKQDECEKLLK